MQLTPTVTVLAGLDDLLYENKKYAKNILDRIRECHKAEIDIYFSGVPYDGLPKKLEESLSKALPEEDLSDIATNCNEADHLECFFNRHVGGKNSDDIIQVGGMCFSYLGPWKGNSKLIPRENEEKYEIWSSCVACACAKIMMDLAENEVTSVRVFVDPNLVDKTDELSLTSLYELVGVIEGQTVFYRHDSISFNR